MVVVGNTEFWVQLNRLIQEIIVWWQVFYSSFSFKIHINCKNLRLNCHKFVAPLALNKAMETRRSHSHTKSISLCAVLLLLWRNKIWGPYLLLNESHSLFSRYKYKFTMPLMLCISFDIHQKQQLPDERERLIATQRKSSLFANCIIAF